MGLKAATFRYAINSRPLRAEPRGKAAIAGNQIDPDLLNPVPPDWRNGTIQDSPRATLNQKNALAGPEATRQEVTHYSEYSVR